MEEKTFLDLAPITRHLRAMYSSRLLIAAVHHLKVFETLADDSLTISELQSRFRLNERPAMVLFPALAAMEMLRVDENGRFSISELGRHLRTNASPTLINYVGLEKNDPGVREMTIRLQNDGPLAAPEGVSYVKEGDEPSPMDDPDLSRSFTLALAGRAQYLSPMVAGHMPESKGHLLDVAGGTGLFTCEWLLRNPEGSATILDRPQVLAVAGEFLEKMSRSGRPHAHTLRERVTFLPGDMLTDALPPADFVLAASLFHDWPTPACRTLTERFARALNPGGELWVHDAFLNDTLDGPLPVTDYSAQLFWATKGRAYSRREYREWMTGAGLRAHPENLATAMDYGLIRARLD
jgi:ubiquinone/menaquinone biosynthesis C-methylase UbiE